MRTAVFVLAAVTAVYAAPVDERWHDADHPIAQLFKRVDRRAPSPNDPNFASNYPGIGSTPPTNGIPKAWLDKLATVQLPSFGPSSPNNGYPTYGNGLSGADPTVCSFTYQCTTADDLYNPPNGTLALTFDDGPAGGSSALYDFLAKNNASSKATHFMIGGSILANPTQMQAALNAGGLIAVHTWSHPYMTTLSNNDVVAELGWTMQIISDLSGGRVPKYWRPPFGDVDNRVRAIAKGVFGLTTVPWNQDSADWAIGNNPQYTLQSQEAAMSGWLSGPKSPGLCILEHELNSNTVQVFMDSYPKMVSNGWKIGTVADAWNMDWYQNSKQGNNGPVASMSVAAAANTFAVSNSSASASASQTGSASASGSASSSATSMTSSASASRSSSASSSASGSAAAAAAATSKSAAGPLAVTGGWLAAVGAVSALFL